MTPNETPSDPDSESDLASAADESAAHDVDERRWDPAAVGGEGTRRVLPDGGSRTQRVTIRFSDDELADIDAVVDRSEYDNRSEVIRAGVETVVDQHVECRPMLADGSGGSKYYNPTGEGYVGTITLNGDGGDLRPVTIQAVDWPPSTTIYVHEHDGRLHFGADPDLPGERVGTRTVSKRTKRAPKVKITEADGERILRATEDTLRVYLARDDPGLVLVPQARDPFVDDTDASTGGGPDGD